MIADPNADVCRIDRRLACGKMRDSNYVDHSHIQHEVICLMEGELLLLIDGVRLRMTAGDLLFIPSCHIHSMYTPRHSLSFMVGFTPEEVPQFQRLIQQVDFRPVLIRREQQSEELCAQIQKLEKMGEIGDSLRFVSQLDQLLSSLTPALLADAAALCPPLRGADATYEKALRYVGGKVPARVALKEAAQALDVSSSYLSRLISSRLGLSFSSYAALLRTYGAMRMLEQTAEKSKNIAAHCGFESVRTFNRIFLQFSGYTPRQFRRLYTGGIGTYFPIPAVAAQLRAREEALFTAQGKTLPHDQ